MNELFNGSTQVTEIASSAAASLPKRPAAKDYPTRVEKHSGMGHYMSSVGIVSNSELGVPDRVSIQDAAPLDRQQMIQHHESGVDVAATVVVTGAGSGAVAMAKSIVSSLTERIFKMQNMIAPF